MSTHIARCILNRFAGGALAAALLVAGPLNAQPLPGGAEPGRIEQQFAPPPVPRAVQEPLLPDTQEQLPPEQADKIRFTLTAIALQGNTVFSEADLAPIYQQYLGQEISLTTVYQIANAIAAHYRNAGYVLSRVTPPAQRVSNGIVSLVITEGYIDKIEVEGDVKGNRDLLDSYLSKITESKPLNNKVLERYVLLINDLPGIQAKAVLIPSFDKPGASDLVLQVVEDPGDLTLSVDNRGTVFIGPMQFRAQGGLNNYLGRSERIGGQIVTTREREELMFVQLDYAEPLGTNGTVLSLSGNISWSEPGDALKAFDVKGQNRSITATVTHPWLRSRKKNLSLRGSFTYRNSQTDIGGIALTEDRLRILRVGSSADFTDRWRGVNLFDTEISQGLNLLDSTESGNPLRTRANGREDFTKITASALRVQQIYKPVQLVVGVTGQYALSSLLASEEFGFGGAQYGRAYDPSQLTGDHGVAVRGELQYHVPYTNPILRSLDLYTFYDNGMVWHIDTTTPARENRDSAASAGIGARFLIKQRYLGYIEIADPLTGTVPTRGTKGNDPRFFFSLAAPF